jgi:hypothetical protein
MLLPLVLVLAALAAIAGCGAEEGSAAGRSSAGPAAFPDEAWAELASDGKDNLWLAVAGYTRDGEFGLRVFEKAGLGWEKLPIPPGRVSGDLPLSIAVASEPEGSPCLGYSIGSKPAPILVCFDGADWTPLNLSPPGGAHLIQIEARNGDLVALFDKQGPKGASYRLMRNTGAEWVSAPPIFAPPAIALLAIEGPQEMAASFPQVGFATQARQSQHFVAELRGGGWRKLQPALHGLGTGPLLSGPVLLGDRILYPVNQADTEPWSFSVLTARIGSARANPERLSTGRGNAQGRLDLAGGRVWATWQEHDPLRTGGFQTGIFAAELTPKGKLRRKVRLWRGVSIGPGSTQVVEFEGRTLALYMRGSASGRGLQATVKALG